MFTLQILDRGQSFLHSLDAAPVRIGSAEGADLRLGEAGVERDHARLEPRGDGVRLRALGPVRLNGREVDQADLQLGDRIEIGKAVLVVGRAVTRRARPEEVLADTAAPRRTTRSAARARTKSKVAWLPFAVAGLVLVGIAYLLVGGDDTTAIRNELAIVARLRDAGQLEDAGAALARLRQRWAGATDGRLRQVDEEQQRLDAVHAEVERMRDQVRDPAVDRSYADWIRELRRLEDTGQPIERVAARRVRATLRETLEQRPPAERIEPVQVAQTTPAPTPIQRPPAPVTPPETPSEPPPVAVRPVPTPSEPTPVAVQPTPTPSEPVPVAVEPEPTPNEPTPTESAPAAVQSEPLVATESIGAEAERLAREGLFAQAMTLLQDAKAAAADAQQVAALQQRLDDVRAAAKARLDALLAESERLVAESRAADAVALLAGARFQFPGTSDFEALPQALARAQVALTGVRPDEDEEEDDPVAWLPGAGERSGPTSAIMELRSNMEAARRAEEDGAFAAAARILRETAAMVREQDAAFATRLEARAEAADLQAAWHEHMVAVLRDGRPLKATTRDGQAVTLQGTTDEALTVTSADGLGELTWPRVSSFGLSLLVEATAPTGRAALGAATLFYGAGDAERAEALLAKTLPGDAALKPLVDGVLARGRGEPVDERGYTLGRGGFVSVRAAELQKEVKKFAARLEGALKGRDAAAREALVTEAMRGGPDSLQVLVMALRQEFDGQLARIEASPIRKQLEKLDEQRTRLDAARDAARALIYDEVRYFYPYKPPAVSSDKFAEYNRVQAEVDDVVDALREVWKDDRLRVRVPATLQDELERLDWAAKTLGRLGPFASERLAAVEWARALPSGDAVGVRDYCRTVAERDERAQWRLVDAYNAIAQKAFPSSVREQLKITNDYRAMFDHRPLAIVPVICTAAQGHAEEMTRLGYFSHFSPVAGRSTPYDRMQLAGYTAGVSENIALCDSASTAHLSWCRSSGHHRNLLDPGHHEIGIGADGRHWVQNFGSGLVYQTEPAWQSVTASTR